MIPNRHQTMPSRSAQKQLATAPDVLSGQGRHDVRHGCQHPRSQNDRTVPRASPHCARSPQAAAADCRPRSTSRIPAMIRPRSGNTALSSTGL